MLAIADDLSGAAETAAALALPSGRSAVRVGIRLGAAWAGGAGPALADEVSVIDLDSRALPPEQARAAVRAAVSSAPADVRIYAKVDSLWRGNVAAAVAALLDPGRPVVLAPALPAAERTVIGGRLRIGGVLGAAASWALEAGPAPRDLGELLAGLPVVEVPLETVRGGRGPLAGVFAAASASGPVVFACDAETDADLDLVAAAAAALPGARLAGSGGLASALGRLLAAGAIDRPGRRADAAAAAAPPAASAAAGRAHPLLLIGTAEAVARRQIAELARRVDLEHVRLGSAEILDGAPGLPAAGARLAAALAHRPAVVDIDPGLPAGGARAEVRRAIRTALAELARGAGARDLMLTGGETARVVLDALGIGRLAPLRVLDIGTIASAAPDGRIVVTRPGSFGGDDNLVLVHDHLREERDRP